MFLYHLHLQYIKLNEVQQLMLLLDIIDMELYYAQVLHHHVLEILLQETKKIFIYIFKNLFKKNE